MKTDCRFCAALCPKAAAVALGRWALGVLLLVAGLGKFYWQGKWSFAHATSFATTYLPDKFRDTWLPAWTFTPFGYALPYVELTLGMLLLLGLGRNPVLFAAGLLFLSLAFGTMLMKEYAMMHENLFFVFLTAVVLFNAESDRWRLPCLCACLAGGDDKCEAGGSGGQTATTSGTPPENK